MDGTPASHICHIFWNSNTMFQLLVELHQTLTSCDDGVFHDNGTKQTRQGIPCLGRGRYVRRDSGRRDGGRRFFLDCDGAESTGSFESLFVPWVHW